MNRHPTVKILTQSQLSEEIIRLIIERETIAKALGFTRCACGDNECGAWFPPNSDEPCLLATADIIQEIDKLKRESDSGADCKITLSKATADVSRMDWLLENCEIRELNSDGAPIGLDIMSRKEIDRLMAPKEISK